MIIVNPYTVLAKPKVSGVTTEETNGVVKAGYTYSHPDSTPESLQDTKWSSILFDGIAEVGSELTGIVDPVGVYTYQWFLADDYQGVNDTLLGGEVADAYTPISADLDKYLRLVATDTNGEVYSSYYIAVGQAATLLYVMVEEGSTNEVMLVFDRDMSLTDETGWSSEKNDASNSVTAAANFENIIRLTVTNAIAQHDLVTVSHDSGTSNTIAHIGGLVLADITERIADNFIGESFGDKILTTFGIWDTGNDQEYLSWNMARWSPAAGGTNSIDDLIDNTGVASDGTITCVGVLAGDTANVNNRSYLAVAGAKAGDHQFSIDTGDNECAADLASSIFNDTRGSRDYENNDATATGNVVTSYCNITGTGGDTIGLTSSNGTRLAVSGAVFSGGVDPVSSGIKLETIDTENNALSDANTGDDAYSTANIIAPAWDRIWTMYDDNADYAETGLFHLSGFTPFEVVRFTHAIKQKGWGAVKNHHVFRTTGHAMFNPTILPPNDNDKIEYPYMAMADVNGNIDVATAAGSFKETPTATQMVCQTAGMVIERATDFDPRTEGFDLLLLPMGAEEPTVGVPWFNWGSSGEVSKDAGFDLPDYDIVDRAMNFDGTNNEMIIFPHTAFSGAFEIWIVFVTASVNAYVHLLSLSNGKYLRIQSDADIDWTGTVLQSSLSASTEYRMRLVINDASSTVEIKDSSNAVVKAETTVNLSTGGFSSPSMLGTNNAKNGNWFNGKIKAVGLRETLFDTTDKNSMFDWIHNKIK